MKWRSLTDWFWPTLEPESPLYVVERESRVEEHVASREAACLASADRSREWLDHELGEYDAEERRAEQARTFHQAMLGTGGVAVTATLGLLAWFEPAKVVGLTKTSTVLFKLAGLYLVVQLIGVVRGALLGIGVRSHERLPHPPPLPNEAIDAYDRRKAAAVSRAQAHNTDQNDHRISAKRLVLRCWQNFAVGLLLIVCLAVIALIHNGREP